MRINATKKIVTEDFSSTDRALAQKLAQILNPFLDQTSTALTNQLTPKDNLKGKTWTALDLPAGTPTLKLAWTVNELPNHVFCSRLYKKDGSNPSANWSMGWSYANGQLQVAFRGLTGIRAVGVSIASPGVVTCPQHGLQEGDPLVLSTSGALPTGLAAGTTYYVVNSSTDTFSLAASVGSTAINTSGTQSGAQFVTWGTTTDYKFNLVGLV